MDFKVRYAKYDDFLECFRVEKQTMGDYYYLDDAWHYFYNTKGEMICVFDDEKMIGIGKFTVLFDNSAWLETLRVVPEYQSKGAGKLIYNEYKKLAKFYNVKAMAMYTGINNEKSSGLAKFNGLENASEFIGYNLENFSSEDVTGFKLLDYNKANELLTPFINEYNNYLVMNRTFYRFNEDTIKGLSVEGKVFYDEKTNSVIVIGSRFLKNKALHIALMKGDLNKCLSFAKTLAKIQGIEKLTCTFSLENKELEQFLEKNKFIKENSKLKTMEIIL